MSDHCSNITGGVIDMKQNTMNTHESLRMKKSESEQFQMLCKDYHAKYPDRVIDTLSISTIAPALKKGRGAFYLEESP